MDSQDYRRLGKVLFMAGEGLLYIKLFKFAERLIEKDMAFKHLVDQAFESGVNQSSFPVNNRYASR